MKPVKSVLKNETKVIIANCRLSYANIFEPKAFEGQDPKYSVSLIISKEDKETIKLIETAIANAKTQGKEQKWGGKLPKGLKDPETVPVEEDLLKAQIKAMSKQLDFQEELIAELAMKVYE